MQMDVQPIWKKLIETYKVVELLNMRNLHKIYYSDTEYHLGSVSLVSDNFGVVYSLNIYSFCWLASRQHALC